MSYNFAQALPRAFGLSVALIFASTSAVADYFDGNELRKLAGSTNQLDIAMFRGYVAGLQDQGNGTVFCVPESVRLSQAAAVVQKYLQDNPSLWHLAAHQLVVQALQSNFACSVRR